MATGPDARDPAISLVLIAGIRINVEHDPLPKYAPLPFSFPLFPILVGVKEPVEMERSSGSVNVDVDVGVLEVGGYKCNGGGENGSIRRSVCGEGKGVRVRARRTKELSLNIRGFFYGSNAVARARWHSELGL